MKIAVLGTGVVGRTLAARFDDLGHEVAVGTRDPTATLARTQPDAMGTPRFSTWLDDHPGIRLMPYPDAAQRAELIVNATNGAGSIQALTLAGAANLSGKVLLDVSNPLDFSGGMPPTLFVKDSDSLAELIQRTFPDTRVVKALNTMSALVQAHPEQLAGGEHTVLVSGDDTGAKQTVTLLLQSMGHTDVFDLGDITTARGAEMYLPLWLRLWGALGTPMFNIKVVR